MAGLVTKVKAHVRGTLFNRRPELDRTLCHAFRRGRLKLPDLLLDDLFPDSTAKPVCLYSVPRGLWSAPLDDVVTLLKAIVSLQPRRLMEVGSFRGYTALSWARHLPSDARIVTIDSYPDHGEAYRGTEFEPMFERRIGDLGPGLFEADAPGSYDFIFVDASHTYDSVKRDSGLVLPLLAPKGFIFWHDYANYGYYSKHNGVPEYLHEIARERPAAHIIGSNLAVHSPAWIADESTFVNSISRGSSDIGNPWTTDRPRGQY